MSTLPIDPGYYADFAGLERLRGAARADHPDAIRAAARQFESLFTRMLLKTMREASLADGLGDSDQTKFYQDMYDQQLSVALSQGKGLGLADILVEQLTRSGLAKPAAAKPEAGAAASTAAATPAQQADFVRSMTPFAEEAGRRLGVAPETVIAHAALETGWGRHLPTADGQSSHNYFGIKAQGNWQGAAVQATTTEFAAGSAQRVAAAFRSYTSPAASVTDFTQLISGNPRYAAALDTGADTHAYATALKRGGYATDPDYVGKLVATAAAVRELRAGDELKSGKHLPTNTPEGSA
jgi:flagellar protein FlgJ